MENWLQKLIVNRKQRTAIRLVCGLLTSVVALPSAYAEYAPSGACRGYRPLGEAVEFVEFRKQLADRMLKTERLNLKDMERVFTLAKIGAGASAASAAVALSAIGMIAGVPYAIGSTGYLVGAGALLDGAAYVTTSAAAMKAISVYLEEPQASEEAVAAGQQQFRKFIPDPALLAKASVDYFSTYPKAHSGINRLYEAEVKKIDESALATTILGYRIVFDLGFSDWKYVRENVKSIKSHITVWEAEYREAEVVLENLAMVCELWGLN